MICNCKNPVTEITSVAHMQWKSGNFEIAPRYHSALAFRINGNATITVNNRSYFVNTNDVLYLPQGIPYGAQYSDTELLVIHFKTATNDPVPEVYSCANAEEIYKAFLSAHILWQEKTPGYEAYTLSKLYTILGQLSANEITTHIPQPFLNAVSYINSNYRDNMLSIERICKHVGINATSLRLLFQKHYQETPTEYITKLRLECARNLISCGISVEQAAQRSGFNDAKYFSRVVKKYFLCSPRELKSYGR